MADESEKTRVLVVDDEPLVAETLTLILEKAGLKAQAAYSGPEAINLMKAFDPDAMIADVVMNGMTGIELAMDVARTLPRCRILLFSGRAVASDLEPAEAAGYHFQMLSKPVHPQVILDWLGGAPVARPSAAWRRARVS